MFRNAPKKRTARKNQRIRQLRHEQLEDRRLLTTGSISGTVFEDLNANGVQDAGEVGLVGIDVTLQRTNATGTYMNPAPEDGDRFGHHIAVLGDNLVISANTDSATGLNSGSVYVVNPETGEVLLPISNPGPQPIELDNFGFAVAVVGNNVLVSAPGDDTPTIDAGAAYLFDGSSGSLLQTFRLDVEEAQTGDWLGTEAVAFGGDVLLGSNATADHSGKAVLFASSDGSVIHTFQSPTPFNGDQFGESLAVSGNSILIGAPEDPSVFQLGGAVYLYGGDTGQRIQSFFNPSPAQSDEFGSHGAVAFLGESVIIGAEKDDTSGEDAGIAYVFDIATGDLVRTFHNPSPLPGDQFGHSVGVIGNTVIIGANGENSAAGAIHFFDAESGSHLSTIVNPTPDDYDRFGKIVVPWGNQVLVGTPNDDLGHLNAGAVYVYDVPMATVTDSQGNYSFTALDTGTYEVRQIVPDGYSQTVPGGDGTHTVPLDVDEAVSGIDFGNLAYTTRVSTDTPMSLQDGKNAARPGVTTSTIDVSGLSNILDLNVTVDISHSYVGQLSATLIAPDGTPVELFGNVGGSGDNFTATTFDDDAVLPIASGTAPFTATFHPEGSLADFNGLNASGIWTLEIVDNAKGDTGTLDSWSLQIAAYEPSPNVPPVADAGGTYSGTEDLTVSLDAGNSYDLDGSIVEYTWDFGDGTMPVTRSSPTVDHTYLWGDTFAVTLTVLDDRGGTATDSATATVTEVNDLPVAEVGGPYNGTVAQAVNFDGSNSSDFDNEDGTTDNDQTLTFSWDFGDGSDPVSGETVSHTYAAADTYTVTLTVNDGVATDVQTTTVEIADEPFATTMHVSDLDGAVNDLGRFWEAVVTITVLDDSGAAVPNATVYGTWSGDTSGSESVTTDTDGQATVVSDKVLDKKDMVVFTVDDILDPSPLTYEPADNTDPDDDSDGTTIIVLQSSPASLLATDNFHATVDAESLTRSQAEAAAREALALWSTQPGIALPRDVHVQVADLPGNTLGWASGSTIVLDHNANGAGWNLDVAGSTGRVDLLTAVSHEIGHLLGYEHNSDPHDVMAATLSVDTRRLPGLESIFIQPVTVNGHSLELKTDIMSTAKSRDTVAESNFDLFLTPLVMNRVQQITSSPEAYEGRMLDDILDEETELVEEELLDLLLS